MKEYKVKQPMSTQEKREALGKIIKEQREALGWSVEQIAQMAEIKPVTVEKIEAGAFNVTFDIIARVAEVLSCEVTLMEK